MKKVLLLTVLVVSVGSAMGFNTMCECAHEFKSAPHKPSVSELWSCTFYGQPGLGKNQTEHLGAALETLARKPDAEGFALFTPVANDMLAFCAKKITFHQLLERTRARA